ncbi:MAG: rod shape-determining protein [Clostridia bacterium]|nr:rod shape-determining protein [Clostridia bacterium]
MPGINIGLDIGTSSVVFYVQDKGVVLSEPTVTANYTSSGKMISTGTKAYKMIGRTSENYTVKRPVSDGIVTDFTAMQNIIRYHLQKICGNRIFKPHLIINMPIGITNLEKRALLDLATSSGAASACLIEEPIAAALGAGIDYKKPRGTMVVNIGAGTTDIAVLTMGNLSVCSTIKTAGNALDSAICRYLRHERDLVIGEITAEDIKKKIGCSYMRDAEIAIQVKGKSYLSSLPTLFEITSTEIFLSIREQLEVIANSVHDIISETPPELLCDITESGIVLTGGTAKLPGLDKLIQRKTHIKTRVAPDPEFCVAKGLGVAVSHPEYLQKNGYIFKSKGDLYGYGSIAIASEQGLN